MDRDFIRDWAWAANALWQEFGARFGGSFGSEFNGQFGSAVPAIERAVASLVAAAGSVPVREAFDREGLAVLARDRMAADSRSPHRIDDRGATSFSRNVATKCLRLGYGVAKDDVGFAYPAEILALRHVAASAESEKDRRRRHPGMSGSGPSLVLRMDEFLRRLGPPAATAPPVGGDVVVEFVLACPGDAGKTTRCVGHLPVRALSEDEAPVAFTLRTAPRSSWDDPESERSNKVHVRIADGKHYRPVLAPGCWRPASVAEFAAAAASGEPWVDSPFAGTSPRRAAVTYPPLSLGEEAAVRDAPSPVRDRLVSECLARMGDVVSVNGVVYRETAAPTLHVVAGTSRTVVRKTREAAARSRGAVGLAWKVGDLRMDTMQDVLPSAQVPAFDWFEDGVDLRAGDVDEPHPAFSFPVGQAEVALDFSARLARELGLGHVDGMPVVAHETALPEWESLVLSLAGKVARLAGSGYGGPATVAHAIGPVVTRRMDDLFEATARNPPRERSANGRVATSAALAAGRCVVAAMAGRYETAPDDECETTFLTAMASP